MFDDALIPSVNTRSRGLVKHRVQVFAELGRQGRVWAGSGGDRLGRGGGGGGRQGEGGAGEEDEEAGAGVECTAAAVLLILHKLDMTQ